MRRILALSQHSRFIGGGEHSFVDLLARLPAEWEPLALVPAEGPVAQALRRNAVRVCRQPLPALRPWNAALILTAIVGLARRCRREEAALLYANGSRAQLYAGLVGKMLSLPVVWHCRVAQQDPWADPVLARLSTRIVANSRATAARFRGRRGVIVETVYNGVDRMRFRPLPPEPPARRLEFGHKMILMVARRSPWKRHDLAVEAFERLAPVEPGAVLVFVGGRDPAARGWERHLERRLRQSPFRSRILLYDAVEDLRPLYWAARVFLLTSRDEPFGRVLVEAMACGVPAVVTAGGGVAEVVCDRESGFVVPPHPETIAAVLLRLLRDEPLHRRMAESATRRAARFGLDEHVAAMSRCFRRVVCEAHGRPD